MMANCPKCSAVFDDSVRICTSCGAELPLSIKPKSEDADLLKDKWTFSGLSTESDVKAELPVDSPAKPPATTGGKPVGMGYDVSHKKMLLHDSTARGLSGNQYSSVQKAIQISRQQSAMGPIGDAQPGRTQIMGVNPIPGPARRPIVDNSKNPGNKQTEIGMAPLGSQIATPRAALSGSNVPESEKSVPPSVHVAPEQDSSSDVKNISQRNIQIPRQNPSRDIPIMGKSAKRTPKQRTSPRRSGKKGTTDSIAGLQVALGVASAILIGMWFVPNLWIGEPVFPASRIATARGISLLGIICKPVVGVIFLALLIAPFNGRFKSSISLPVGLFSLLLAVLLPTDVSALPLDPLFTILATLTGITAMVVISEMLGFPGLGHVALVLVPLALLGITVYGIVTGQYLLGQMLGFKTPLEIYGAMLVSGVSLTTFLRTPRRG